MIIMKNLRMRLLSLTESHDSRECTGCEICDEINQLRLKLGIIKEIPKKEETVVAKPKLEMTVQEYVDLRFVQKKTYLQIAQLKGVVEATVFAWKDRNKNAIKKEMKRLDIQEKARPVKDTKQVIENVDFPKSHYEKQIQGLKEEIASLKGAEDANKLVIKNLEKKVKEFEQVQLVSQDAARLVEENYLLKRLLKHYL